MEEGLQDGHALITQKFRQNFLRINNIVSWHVAVKKGGGGIFADDDPP